MDKSLPEFIAVVSSQIEAIAFDAEEEAMFIRFPPPPGKTQGSLHRYDCVPAEVFDAFAAAESKGSFFYRNIKSAKDEAGMLRYPYKKLPGVQSVDATKSESGAPSIDDSDVPF
jgi:KTSC domain